MVAVPLRPGNEKELVPATRQEHCFLIARASEHSSKRCRSIDIGLYQRQPYTGEILTAASRSNRVPGPVSSLLKPIVTIERKL